MAYLFRISFASLSHFFQILLSVPMTRRGTPSTSGPMVHFGLARPIVLVGLFLALLCGVYTHDEVSISVLGQKSHFLTEERGRDRESAATPAPGDSAPHRARSLSEPVRQLTASPTVADDEDDTFEIHDDITATGSMDGRALSEQNGKVIELGGKKLYQVIQAVVTIPKIKPGEFRKKWSKQYAQILAEELERMMTVPIKVRVTGEQGEDTGSGVFTQIMFGEEISQDRISRLIDHVIKRDFGSLFDGMFGSAVHMEAIADTCIMDKDFQNVLDDTPQLVPTLHASIALESRRATRKNMKKYCPRAAKALRNWLAKNADAAATSTYDFFVDNDKKLGGQGGHKSKPVCNVHIQGPSREDLLKLQDLIVSIGGYRGKKPKQNVLFDSSLRLGKVHIEGGTLIPSVCGSLPSSVVEVRAPRIMEVEYIEGGETAMLVVAEPTSGKPPYNLTGVAKTPGQSDTRCPCEKISNTTSTRAHGLDTAAMAMHTCHFDEENPLDSSKNYTFSVMGRNGDNDPLPMGYVESPVASPTPSPSTSPSPVASPSPSPTPNPTPSPTPTVAPVSTPTCSSAPTASAAPSVTASAGGVSLALAWTAVSGSTVDQIETFCVASGGTCSGTPVGSGINTVTSGISSATTSTVSGLTGSTAYDCFVKLTNACGSSCSSAGSQTTLTSCTPPAAPTGVTATAVTTSTGHMNVQWTYVASTTWTVKCVDNSGSSATCAGTSVGTVQAFTCTTSPCSTTVTGLTDNTPYICCVDSALTATPTCKSSPASSASVTTCTTPVAPTVSSVTATASDTLTVSWGSVSNAVSYSYFCAAGASQPNTAPSVGGHEIPLHQWRALPARCRSYQQIPTRVLRNRPTRAARPIRAASEASSAQSRLLRPCQ